MDLHSRSNSLRVPVTLWFTDAPYALTPDSRRPQRFTCILVPWRAGQYRVELVEAEVSDPWPGKGGAGQHRALVSLLLAALSEAGYPGATFPTRLTAHHLISWRE